MGDPSICEIQLGSRLAPTRAASPSLLPAMAEVAASKRNGGLFLAGAAIAIGLVPNLGSAPNVGSTLIPPAVAVMPIISSLAASIA